MVRGVHKQDTTLIQARPYILTINGALLGYTGPRTLNLSVKTIFPMPTPIPIPNPNPIAGLDCLFARFARFAGAETLNHAPLIVRIYGFP